MIVRAIKTRLVTAKACTLQELLDESITELSEGSVVAIASKVVSLCEGRVAPMDTLDKDALVAKESQLYIPGSLNPYGVTLSVARDLLVVAAGIDESNSDGQFVLWPSDPQASVNEARAFLRQKFGLKELGVILTDSATRPFQWGTTGIAVAYSGIEPVHSYIGSEDLFGRTFGYQKNNIQNGLAAAATLVGGEGSEQTPIVVLEELGFVRFVEHDPTNEELEALRIDPDADVYSQLIKGAPWQKGDAA